MKLFVLLIAKLNQKEYLSSCQQQKKFELKCLVCDVFHKNACKTALCSQAFKGIHKIFPDIPKLNAEGYQCTIYCAGNKQLKQGWIWLWISHDLYPLALQVSGSKEGLDKQET